MQPIRRLTAALFAHPRWLAPALGALAACGFQPLALWPLTLLAVAGLIELTARARRWQDAALIGWLFGVGHFTVGNNWIATAFTYQANMPAWLGGIAVVLLSLYLAVYPMFGVLGAWAIGRRGGETRLTTALAFASLLSAYRAMGECAKTLGELALQMTASGTAPSDPLGIVRLQTLGLIRKPIGDARWYVTEQGVRWLESHALRPR